MKKIFRLFAAFAATTVAFSCMEEANPEVGTQNGGSSYNGPMTTIEFTLADLETKTAWDGENHTWSDGDQVKIIWGTEADAFVNAEVVDGTVSATVGVADTYYAVYPATTEYVLTAEDQFSVTIPKIQDGTFASANIMAAKTSATEATLAFKNLTHIIKFNLSEGCEYNLFRFRSNAKNKNNNIRMAGTPSLITFDNDDVTVGTPANGTNNTGYAIVKLARNATGPFYLGIRAGACLDGGFGVLASKTASENNLTGGALTTSTIETKRSNITYIGVLDSYISDDWYIKPEATGNGSGKDWANAADISLLLNLLTNKTASGETYVGNGTTDFYRLTDAKIHMAAGEYNIEEANGSVFAPEFIGVRDNKDISVTAKVTIIGGYPENPSETSVPEITENGSNTVFTTKEGENSRVMKCDGTNLGNITFDGISFTSSKEVKTAGNLDFRNAVKGNMTFRNCYFSFKSSQSAGGGSIRITPNDSGDISVLFQNCIFHANEAREGTGAAVYVNGTKANVVLDECTFTDNIVKSSGGAIYNKGKLTLTKCVFRGNTTATNGYGGAIYHADGIMVVDSCSFIENGLQTGYRGGAIHVGEANSASSPQCYIYNSIFERNFASNQGGAIRTNTSTGALVIVNSTFHQNSTNNGSIRLRNYTKGEPLNAWIISCTTDESANALYNHSCNAYVYNTLISSFYTNNGNGSYSTTFSSSISVDKLYGVDNNVDENESVVFADQVGTYSNGVLPINPSSIAETNGMSSTDLAALGAEGSALMTAMPLFDATKLTVDQKGNSREGKTVMGAYVGE